MTRSGASGGVVARLSGTIKWRPGGGSPAKGLRQLGGLLRDITKWPLQRFASEWWPGDYRLLRLTVNCPGDLNAEVTCHTAAGSEFMTVSVNAAIRSTGRTRALSRVEQAELAGAGFGAGSAGRAELIHKIEGTADESDLAGRILRGLVKAFEVTGVMTLKYHIESDSRLDSMPVFQDIRVHELLPLLCAAGFQATIDQDGEGRAESEGPLIIVHGDVPFSIQLAEPQDGAYLTLRFEARLPGQGSPALVDALNQSWSIGAVAVDERALIIRQQISVTGGISYAGLRDRLDEWVSGVSEARGRLTAG